MTLAQFPTSGQAYQRYGVLREVRYCHLAWKAARRVVGA